MIDIFAAFSRYRFSGEPIPPDVEILLSQRDELLRLTGFELNWQADWAPWLATNYLANEDQSDPEIMAGVRAIAEVCDWIAFIAADDCDNYIGYWRGPEHQAIDIAPLVIFDNEGEFTLCPGKNFLEALLWRIAENSGECCEELRDWSKSLSLELIVNHPDDFLPPQPVSIEPNEYVAQLFERYRYG